MKYKEYMEFKEYKTIVLHAENAPMDELLHPDIHLVLIELLKNKILWEN